MKTNLKSNSILLGGLLLLGTVFSCTQAEQDYASYVNPFIGTGGHGHTYPGAVVPNGMIQPSPDTTHLRMGRLFRIPITRILPSTVSRIPMLAEQDVRTTVMYC